MVMKKYKWIFGVFILFFLGIGIFFIKDKRSPLKYEGEAFLGTLLGEMIVGKNDAIFMLERSKMPRIEFSDFDPPSPEDFDSFTPPLKEEWMGDIKERSNRATISFSRQYFEDHSPELLFRRYGQYRYLWMDYSKNKIKVLIGWYDNHKDELHYQTLLASDNGGMSFYQQKSFVDRGNVKDNGVFFSRSGQYGYIFIDDYILGTTDYGDSWGRIDYSLLPYKITRGRQLPVETATVDDDGNFYMVLYKEIDSYIYKIKPGAYTAGSQPENIIYNKHLISLNVLDKNELYYFYIECETSDCHSKYTKYLYSYAFASDQLNQPTSLKFSYLDHKNIEHQYTFDFLYELKRVHTHKNKIGATLIIPNTNKYLLITSYDYGASWETYDFDGQKISADYLDIEEEKYWIHNYRGQIYSLSDIFNINKID